MSNEKLIKAVAVVSIVSLCIANLISCKGNVEVKISNEGVAEQSESVNIDVVETTMSLESSTQIEETTEIESSIQEIMEESLAESKEETQGETQEETQSEKQEETTTQETQKAKVQGKTGTDKNGHPYIDPEKYATWEQQIVDKNKLKEIHDKNVEKLYQYMLSIIVDTPTDEKLSQIRQIVEDVVPLDSEIFIKEYKKGLVYTFDAEGKPIEAPQDKYDNVIVNPNTGIEYWYSDGNCLWRSSEGSAQDIARMHAMRDNIMDAQGHTNLRKMTPEERAEIAAGIARAMGAD